MNNWRAVARRLAEKNNYIFHVMDARNHGESPRSNEMSYKTMTDDIIQYINNYVTHRDVGIIGHSMV
jgi:esterase